VWLFHAADSRLGYAHSPGQLNLGQFGCLPQRGQAHRIGAVSLVHVTANLGDAFGQIWPLSQLADAVVTAAPVLRAVQQGALRLCPGFCQRVALP